MLGGSHSRRQRCVVLTEKSLSSSHACIAKSTVFIYTQNTYVMIQHCNTSMEQYAMTKKRRTTTTLITTQKKKRKKKESGVASCIAASSLPLLSRRAANSTARLLRPYSLNPISNFESRKAWYHTSGRRKQHIRNKVAPAFQIPTNLFYLLFVVFSHLPVSSCLHGLWKWSLLAPCFLQLCG